MPLKFQLSFNCQCVIFHSVKCRVTFQQFIPHLFFITMYNVRRFNTANDFLHWSAPLSNIHPTLFSREAGSSLTNIQFIVIAYVDKNHNIFHVNAIPSAFVPLDFGQFRSMNRRHNYLTKLWPFRMKWQHTIYQYKWRMMNCGSLKIYNCHILFDD